MSPDHVSAVRSLVAAHMPGYRVGSVLRLGEGLDNTAFDVNGELILRFSKEPDPGRRAEQVTQEARLLAVVKDIASLAVPEPQFTDEEQGCLAYFKIPGSPLLDVPSPRRSATSIAATLGGLLSALHAAPLAQMEDIAGRDELPLEDWRSEAAQTYPTVADQIPGRYHPPIEAFLASSPPAGPDVLVFSHNDLGIEHVLVDPVTLTVTGVIDWSDAAIVDPAGDFGRLYRDLGPAAFDAAAGRLNDPALRERTVFYARCTLFEDLAYGLATGGDKYISKSLTALPWLFPN